MSVALLIIATSLLLCCACDSQLTAAVSCRACKAGSPEEEVALGLICCEIGTTGRGGDVVLQSSLSGAVLLDVPRRSLRRPNNFDMVLCEKKRQRTDGGFGRRDVL